MRVQRLQDITENKAVKEGVYPSDCRNCASTVGCDTCPDEGYDEIGKFGNLLSKRQTFPSMDGMPTLGYGS